MEWEGYSGAIQNYTAPARIWVRGVSAAGGSADHGRTYSRNRRTAVRRSECADRRISRDARIGSGGDLPTGVSVAPADPGGRAVQRRRDRLSRILFPLSDGGGGGTSAGGGCV